MFLLSAYGHLLHPRRGVHVPQGHGHLPSRTSFMNSIWKVQQLPETKPAKGKAEAHFLVHYAGTGDYEHCRLVDKKQGPPE